MDAVFWLLFVAVIGYEAVALAAKRRGWTISGHAWDFRSWRPPWSGVLLDVLMVWLFWHLVVDDLFFVQAASWVDVVVVAGVAAVAYPVERWRSK